MLKGHFKVYVGDLFRQWGWRLCGGCILHWRGSGDTKSWSRSCVQCDNSITPAAISPPCKVDPSTTTSCILFTPIEIHIPQCGIHISSPVPSWARWWIRTQVDISYKAASSKCLFAFLFYQDVFCIFVTNILPHQDVCAFLLNVNYSRRPLVQ